MTAIAPLTVRRLRSKDAAEYYITAMAPAGLDAAEQVQALYAPLAETLEAEQAWLFSERLFATAEAHEHLMAVRAAMLGDRLDGVPPTRLVVPPTSRGPVAGLQVHAIQSDVRPCPLACWNQSAPRAGRSFIRDGKRWLFISSRCAPGSPENGSPGAQADHTFRCARCLLEQVGGSMDSVARTWLWLDRVLDWYADLNATRNRFFREQHLIDPARGKTRLPASTGIGIGSTYGRPLTLDLIAMPGQEDAIRAVEAGGDQDSAYKYGSAFSRACVAPMPGGETLFISGTAAIDHRGQTEYVGDAKKQIHATIAHVRALLAEQRCTDDDVLTALVYAKTPAVLDTFERLYPDLRWPYVSMISDVCRDDLLFEVEATAAATR